MADVLGAALWLPFRVARWQSRPAEALRNMVRVVAPKIRAFLEHLSIINYLVCVIVRIWCLVSSKCWINIWWKGVHRLSNSVHMCVCKGLDKLMEASESVAKLSQDLAVKEKELEVASVKADAVSLHLFYPEWWGTSSQTKEKACSSLQGTLRLFRGRSCSRWPRDILFNSYQGIHS